MTNSVIPYIYGFFFSSRRRHTRYIGDWSSDVCSSDLYGARDGDVKRAHAGAHRNRHPCVSSSVDLFGYPGRFPAEQQRSEERRVGKECRYWWMPYHLKK